MTTADLKPGPQMDAAVALAMGWRPYSVDDHLWANDQFPYGTWRSWSTDNACAVREVLPEIERRGWEYKILSDREGRSCHIYHPERPNRPIGQCVGESPQVSLAAVVCRAFLAAQEKTK